MKDRYAALSAGRVILYDMTLDEQERLPFKDVSSLNVYKDTLTVAMRNTIVVYTYLYNHLEMMAQWKFPENITYIKSISPTLTIVASKTNFYKVEHATDADGKPSSPNIELIDWKAGFTLRSQFINVTAYGEDHVLLTRGSSKCIYSRSQGTITPVSLSGTVTGTIDPFLVVTTGNHIHIHDFEKLVDWQEFKLNKIQLTDVTEKLVTVITRDEVTILSLLNEKEIIDSIKDLESSISLVRQMSYDGKAEKLRELEIAHATQLFQMGQYPLAIQIFTDFCASPFEVVSLYPPSIRDPESTEELEIDEKAVRLLTHFLTDTRRKLNKLLNEPSHELPYHEGILTLDLFTGPNHTVEQIQTAIDTTLFKCYTLINPGLIGSLIRVENHCDPQLVVKTLKERNSMNELIDFYFKRGMHTEALNLLVELAKASDAPELVVRYLHRLKGDQLPLIIDFSKWLISEDEGYGIKIFIDSPYSDTFDRFKVMKFLQTQSDNLERMFLEFIIFELHETATTFHTRLCELYMIQLDTNPESIQFKKLHSFLQTGRYDNKTILSKFTKLISSSPEEALQHLLVLKTITLSRMGKHTDVLHIFVDEIHDPYSAIKYVQDHNTQSLFLSLIDMFQSQDDQKSILHLLSTTATTTPLFTILDIIPQFKVVDLQTYLIKSLRVQHKRHVLKNLEKSLLEVQRVVKTDRIGELEAKKCIIDDDTLCEVCRTKIKGSVFVWGKDGKTVRHFGCKMKETKKLKSLTLKEFNERHGGLV